MLSRFHKDLKKLPGCLGPGVAQWLRHCAASRTVPESIPGGVTGDFFPWLSTEPCALGSTQPLKLSTRDYSQGNGGGCVRLTTLLMPNVKKIRSLNLHGTPWATSGCCGRPLPLPGCSDELSTCFFLAQKEDYSRNGYLSDRYAKIKVRTGRAIEVII